MPDLFVSSIISSLLSVHDFKGYSFVTESVIFQIVIKDVHVSTSGLSDGLMLLYADLYSTFVSRNLHPENS
jgi:hypothetical protein